MNVKIIRSAIKRLISMNHRAMIDKCPHCGHIPDGELSYLEWLKKNCLKEVILDGAYSRPDSVVMVSECPNCFKLSWIHTKIDDHIDSLENSTSDWGVFRESFPALLKALKKERVRRIRAYLDDWVNSCCKNCSLVTDLIMDYYYVKVVCRHKIIGGAKRHCKYQRRIR